MNKSQAMVEIRGTTLSVDVADTPITLERGLSGRESLAENTGMLFVFDHPDRYGFWMPDMHFAIDIFWIKDGTIVSIQKNVPPPAPGTPHQSLPVYYPNASADRVLEGVAGFADHYGVTVGDQVGISLGTPSSDGAAIPVSLVVPGDELSIEYLRDHPATGSDFRLEKVLKETPRYTRWEISYTSDGLYLTGIMNVPKGPVPKSGFPILILNHGLMTIPNYYSGRGSAREQEFFTDHGYITVHPDFRGHASSSRPVIRQGATSSDMASSSANTLLPHHDFYVGYTRDVLGAIDALKNAKLSFADTNRIGMWGHSMGGGITVRAMVLQTGIKAFVLIAPLGGAAEANFYELPASEVEWLHATYGPPGSAVYKKISPETYFADVSAPVQIHQGTADLEVPFSMPAHLADVLKKQGKTVEFYTYHGEGHEFLTQWQLAADRELKFFDRYVKNRK